MEEFIGKERRRTLPKPETETTVGAGLGAEDREAVVHNLWISGPKARPDESKKGRAAPGFGGINLGCAGPRAVRDWRTEAGRGKFSGNEQGKTDLDEGL